MTEALPRDSDTEPVGTPDTHDALQTYRKIQAAAGIVEADILRKFAEKDKIENPEE